MVGRGDHNNRNNNWKYAGLNCQVAIGNLLESHLYALVPRGFVLEGIPHHAVLNCVQFFNQ